jgi:DNA-directed RNA polymerase specialized sigma24 family protein
LTKARANSRRDRRRWEIIKEELAGTYFDNGEPSPLFAAEFADQFEYLLSILPGPEWQQVVIAKLEGHSNDEIAKIIGKSVPTVERRLSRIRDVWTKAGCLDQTKWASAPRLTD